PLFAGTLRRPFLRSPGALVDNAYSEPADPALRCRSSGTKLASGVRYMPQIIRQNPDLPALPDFRNLGVVLRILVVAIAVAAVAAAVEPQRLDLWASQFLDNISVVQPYVLLQLAALYALQPWLARQPYATGAWLVAAITIACGLAVYALIVATRIVAGGDLL